MIIDDRAKNGPFKNLEDLDRVKGFGMKSVDKLRSEVTVSGATRITPAANQITAKPATQPAVAIKTAPVKATPVTASPADKKLSKKETNAVNHLTPNGEVPNGDLLSQGMAMLQNKSFG